jgi:NADH-ubiquinone oxidoreductase chain 4
MRVGLSLLRIWVIALIFMASVVRIENKRSKYFGLILILTLILLLGVFISLDLFIFYLAFEGVLIPTYILIVGWGYQPERLQAGLYLLFYTLIVSLPLLIVILRLEKYLGVGFVLYLRDLIRSR